MPWNDKIIANFRENAGKVTLPPFVGANLLQASFTGFCPLALILKKLGAPAGAAFCAARQQ